MKPDKRKRLKAAGWRTGTAQELLGLSNEEAAYVELRITLAEGLRARRHARGLTQNDLARAISSSQSRVAKMEAGDPSVSLDLLIRSLLALGVSNKELGRMIGS